jgi:hypothetical protein
MPRGTFRHLAVHLFLNRHPQASQFFAPTTFTRPSHSNRATNHNDFPRLAVLDGRKAGRKVLPEMLQTIGGRLKNYDGDFAARQVLLVSQV